MLATLVAVCKDHDTKAESNRRSKVCDVLAGTGISCREKWLAGRSRGEGWSSIRVSRPVILLGRQACIYQHLCSKRKIKEPENTVLVPVL
jgi:hypothetical protein